ncbi:MAG: hypothetical protein H5T82_03655 [Demequina sp.]|uniref:hypothetical protein n=1 Tax=Demequina sp. TaxID=2050685 RepID=UPI0019A0FA19|nr:hypothetical protein [Demequina sp.]MBC7297969.1 hypothetical protein [Demequina sp.]
MHTGAKVAAVALGAMLSLSSCALTASITTVNQYDPSDGTGAVVGDVRAQNLLLVTTAEGEPAALVGYLYNADDATATVDVTVGDTVQTYTIAPMGSVQLGLNDGAEAFITTSPANPGLLGSYTVTVAGSATATGTLPIVDGTLPEYRPVLEDLTTAAQ